MRRTSIISWKICPPRFLRSCRRFDGGTEVLRYTMNPSDRAQSDRERLRALAIRAMRDRGLDPDFSREELAEAASVPAAPATTEEPLRDQRALLWCSIDNDDSRDLDQLSVAEALADGGGRVLVA